VRKLVLFLIVILTRPAIALANNNNDWHMGSWGHMMGGVYMWIVFLVILLVVVYFIVQATRPRSSNREAPEESPMSILKKRYAKGEISREEFERMKKDLES